MTTPNNSDEAQPGASLKPNPETVNEFHRYDDVDNHPDAHHHTLGIDPNQSSPGDHNHDGRNSYRLFGAATITGSRAGNVALANLLTVLAQEGIIVDATTA